ncbi:uncharacterized protein ACA1_088930, partial [Acanthamoeba castellanii str. Neff]
CCGRSLWPRATLWPTLSTTTCPARPITPTCPLPCSHRRRCRAPRRRPDRSTVRSMSTSPSSRPSGTLCPSVTRRPSEAHRRQEDRPSRWRSHGRCRRPRDHPGRGDRCQVRRHQEAV